MLRAGQLEPGTPPPGENDRGPGTADAGGKRPVGWTSFSAGLRFSAAVYLLTRVPVVAAVVLYLHTHPRASLSAIALQKDGWWYLRLAEQGYSSSLRAHLPSVTDYRHNYSEWAFYPGYPLVIRAVHTVTTLPYVASALVASAVLGLLAVRAVYALGAAYGGVRVAQGSALLVAAWPGSAALNWPYSEGLFIPAAAAALVCLHRERWVLAGVLGAVAMLARPSGIAVVAAAAAVAVVQLVRGRAWRPLVAPALASAGGLAFVGYGWLHTGDVLVWRHAENLWHQHLDFSRSLVATSVPILAHPSAELRAPLGGWLLAATWAEVGGVLALAAMTIAAWANRRRLSTSMLVYALVSLGLIIGSSAVGPRPRTVLAVLPGFVWLASWLPRRAVVAVSIVLTVGLGVLAYLWSGLVTP